MVHQIISVYAVSGIFCALFADDAANKPQANCSAHLLDLHDRLEVEKGGTACVCAKQDEHAFSRSIACIPTTITSELFVWYQLRDFP